jgi:hypothetical protein
MDSNKIQSVELYKDLKPFWYLDEIAKGESGIFIWQDKELTKVK